MANGAVKKIKNTVKTEKPLSFLYDYDAAYESLKAFVDFYDMYSSSGPQELHVSYPVRPTRITFPNIEAGAYLAFIFMLELAKRDARKNGIIIHDKPYD